MPRRCCVCSCHNGARGDYKEARNGNDYAAVVLLARVETVNALVPVESADPLEAAVACRLCVNNHCEALSSLAQPKQRSEWTDPPFPPPAEATDEQADGN